MIQEDEQFNSVAVLSELNSEGKTLVTASLALAYSDRLKKKVLVIDTASERGATSALAELLDKTETVDVVALRDWSGLKKGADGGQDADEYQLKILLTQVASQYGLILVDTCALSRRNRNNLDPAVIGRQCDAAILVSADSGAPDEVSVQNRKRLVASGVNLVGMVHNQRSPQRGSERGSQRGSHDKR
jgi:Mrp family chromosome partitioning ATPase